MGKGPPTACGLTVVFIHCPEEREYAVCRARRNVTYVFRRAHATRIVNAHVPLVECGNGPRGLALFLRQTVVLEVADGAACELEEPRCEYVSVVPYPSTRVYVLHPIGVSAKAMTVFVMSSSGSDVMSEDRMNHCRPASENGN